MTREDFMAKYTDEMLGLLLSSFHEHERAVTLEKDSGGAADAFRGMVMRSQMKRARGLLERIYGDLNGKKEGAK